VGGFGDGHGALELCVCAGQVTEILQDGTEVAAGDARPGAACAIRADYDKPPAPRAPGPRRSWSGTLSVSCVDARLLI
jgi:hypothetical protein